MTDGPITYAELAWYPLTAIAALAAKPSSVLDKLAEWEIESVLDLLTTYPRRYIDRTK